MFVYLCTSSRGQLADFWIEEEVAGTFASASSLIWDPTEHLLFLAEDEQGIAQVFRIDPGSGKSEKLTNDTISKIALSFDQANDKLLISLVKAGKKTVIRHDESILNAEPLIPRQLQHEQAHVNAKGNMAAFIGKEENERHWNLYTYDFVYNNLNKLGSTNADHAYPLWSPNADLLSFESRQPDESFTKLRVIHWYGKIHLEIADNDYHIKQASWSPNNQWLAYVMENFGSSKLVICRKNGTDKTIIYESSRKISYPVWSASGSSIAFMLSDDNGQTKIYQLFQH